MNLLVVTTSSQLLLLLDLHMYAAEFLLFLSFFSFFFWKLLWLLVMNLLQHLGKDHEMGFDLWVCFVHWWWLWLLLLVFFFLGLWIFLTGFLAVCHSRELWVQRLVHFRILQICKSHNYFLLLLLCPKSPPPPPLLQRDHHSQTCSFCDLGG